MPISQNLQWIRRISGGLLAVGVLAACGGSVSPQAMAAYQNTRIGERPGVSADDFCALEKSPFASVVDWMNCAGAALGESTNGENSDSLSLKYASRTRPRTRP